MFLFLYFSSCHSIPVLYQATLFHKPNPNVFCFDSSSVFKSCIDFRFLFPLHWAYRLSFTSLFIIVWRGGGASFLGCRIPRFSLWRGRPLLILSVRSVRVNGWSLATQLTLTLEFLILFCSSPYLVGTCVYNCRFLFFNSAVVDH